jgi:hypothetical protein
LFPHLLKQAELTGRDRLEDMLATINMPEVEVTPVRSPNATRTKATQGHPVEGTII